MSATAAGRGSVMILGSGPLAGRLVAALRGERPILGILDDLDRQIAATRPARIIVALEERRGSLPAGPLLEARLRGIKVESGAEAHERLTGKIAIESLTPGALIFGSGFQVSGTGRALCRALSLAVATAGLILGAPLFLLIAVCIVIDSPGGVLFVQDRIGLDGRRFRLLKFRTMHPAGGARSEWVRDNEDRITRVGGVLRRFRLDELPQFVNILRGDMDLVGPRPHPVSNVELFMKTIPYYAIRLRVRPGVTGWAQVRYGYANNLDEETEKMRYDLYYVKHRSPGLDLGILIDTLRIVLLGRGAERPVPPEPARFDGRWLDPWASPRGFGGRLGRVVGIVLLALIVLSACGGVLAGLEFP